MAKLAEKVKNLETNRAYSWGVPKEIPYPKITTVPNGNTYVTSDEPMTIQSEQWGTIVALIGIALGLTRGQVEKMTLLLYPALRGKGPGAKYDTIIELAYRIKQEYPDE